MSGSRRIGGRVVPVISEDDLPSSPSVSQSHEEVPASSSHVAVVNLRHTNKGELLPLMSFGHYPFDIAGDNRKKLVWDIIKLEKKFAILATHYGIQIFPQERSGVYTGWEGSGVRRVLNNDFVSKAFSAKESARIVACSVSGASGTVKDKVVLFSDSELEHYFPRREEWVVEASPYAISNGVKTIADSNGRQICRWGLRNVAGEGIGSFLGVDFDGHIKEFDSSAGFAVRPYIVITMQDKERSKLDSLLAAGSKAAETIAQGAGSIFGGSNAWDSAGDIIEFFWDF